MNNIDDNVDEETMKELTADDNSSQEPVNISNEDDTLDKEVTQNESDANKINDENSSTIDTPKAQNSVVPTDFNSQLAKFQQLLDARSAAQKKAMLISGLSELGQSIAGRHVHGYKPDASIEQTLNTQADQPVNNYISLLQAYKSLAPKTPGAVKRIPVTIIDPNTKLPTVVMVDPQNPKDIVSVGNRAYAPNVFTNPDTKEKNAYQGGTGGVAEITKPKTKIADVTSNNPTPSTSDIYDSMDAKKREEVASSQKEFASETKPFRDLNDKLSGVDALLKEATINPAAANDLALRLAAINVTGRLNQVEIETLGHRKGMFNKLADYAQESSKGVISPDKAKDISDTMHVIANSTKQALNTRAINTAKKFSSIHKDYKPEMIAPMLYPDFQNSTTEYITLQSPDGQIAKVKKDQVQKYIDAGATVVNGK